MIESIESLEVDDDFYLASLPGDLDHEGFEDMIIEAKAVADAEVESGGGGRERLDWKVTAVCLPSRGEGGSRGT